TARAGTASARQSLAAVAGRCTSSASSSWWLPKICRADGRAVSRRRRFRVAKATFGRQLVRAFAGGQCVTATGVADERRADRTEAHGRCDALANRDFLVDRKSVV